MSSEIIKRGVRPNCVDPPPPPPPPTSNNQFGLLRQEEGSSHAADPTSSSKTRSGRDHWKQHVREIVINIGANDGLVHLPIEGGSEFGHFCYLGTLDNNDGNVKFVGPNRLLSGDVLLEIQEQKVAGFTRMDVLAWLNHSCRVGSTGIKIKVTEAGLLTSDLRHYLNTRFIKGSADHDLQNTIRDNLYLRTVPCTTRPKREGEVDGVDYAFLTLDEFLCLERTGNLLESGIYEGNHYGTPKPPKENVPHSVPNSTAVSNGALDESCYLPSVASILFHTNTCSEILLPGAHPSSEGKRRRNRSNVEAMASKSVEPDIRPPPTRVPAFGASTDDGQQNLSHVPSPLELGSLPANWEKAYTEDGEPYFINHTTGSSQWLDPRLARVQKKAIEDCDDDELPYGWEKIDDPQFGTYYIDHINRLTQYENPVLQAKRTKQQQQQPTVDQTDLKWSSSSSRPVFTRNPAELQGTLIATTLIKGPWGFGFTIVGGDDQTEEFLQIKSVIPNGPAFQDGKLLQGDVLVYVNDTCVLGYTHFDVVSLFQSIPVGEAVLLEVCRGYPLSFDLDDPDNEIVTTLAVNVADVQSMGNAELERTSVTPDILYFHGAEKDNPEVLTVAIVKGTMGFGFTIADSASGQKVKKILDRPRCKNLMEGDIMLEINSEDVCGLEHAQVVQFLKDCPQGLEAIIKVQRGGVIAPSGKARPRIVNTAKVQNGSNLKGNGLTQPYNINGTVRRGLYRSKTPTADLYSVVERQATPVRSKTPIVDTRNRAPRSSPIENHRPVTPANHRFCDDVRPATIGETLDNISNHTTNSESQSGGVYNKTISSYSNRWIAGDGAPQSDPKEQQQQQRGCVVVASDSVHSALNNLRIGARTPEGGIDMRQKDVIDVYVAHDDQSLNGTARSGLDVNHWSSSTVDASSDSRNHGGLVSAHDTGPFQESIPLDYNFISSSNANLYGSVHSSSGQGFYDNGHMNHVDNAFANKSNQFDDFMYSARESLHKQGTSFEHEQPSPVNNSARHPLSEREVGLSNNWHASIVPRFPQKSLRMAGYIDSTMTLYRQESGFGFRIIGGTEEGSQVSIGHIVPGGAADLDGRLKSGDEITTVDGQSVLHTSHHHVVQLMGAASNNGRVTLGVRRRVQPLDLPPTKPVEFIYPYDITVVRRENEGFGFVIISSISKAGSTIGRIIDNSPAQRCGQLHVGDRILAVNGVDIMNLHHGDIVNLIKDSGLTATLTIGTPQDDSSSVTSASQRVESAFEEGQYYSVELLRGTRGFGFSIRGGKEFHNMPLFVLRIADGGPAAEDGRLQIGDQLIEINGVNTNNMAHGEAIEIIKHGGSLVRLLVKRGNKFFPNSVNASVSPANVGEFAAPHFSATGMSGPLGQSSPQVAVPAEQDLYFWEYERGPV